jgi:outer membrane protein assembly factor BamB
MTRRCFTGFWLAAGILLPLASGPLRGSVGEAWTEFRGPSGQGHSSATALPIEWSPTTNVAWKQAIAGSGWSSPVVSQGRIYLTTSVSSPGTPPSLRTLCLETTTGRVRWETEVFTPGETKNHPIHGKNTDASPTPIIEGDRLYVHFGHHGTACLDREGRILWRNQRVDYDPVHGNGGSPALVGDVLVFNADGAGRPRVVALDTATGDIRWEAGRSAASKQTFSFSTPLLITQGGRAQIITPGSGAVAALDPLDGREIWRVRYGSGFSVIPRPVFAHGLVFVATGYGRADLLAIRPEGEGDLTDTQIVWRVTKGAPLTPSVVVVGDELYAVADIGLASCFDARTGKLHWQERLEGNYSASPLAADGRIYFQNENGTATVVRASREFTRLAVNRLEERTLASYAVAEGALFIRTATQLYRIQGPATGARGR